MLNQQNKKFENLIKWVISSCVNSIFHYLFTGMAEESWNRIELFKDFEYWQNEKLLLTNYICVGCGMHSKVTFSFTNIHYSVCFVEKNLKSWSVKLSFI